MLDLSTITETVPTTVIPFLPFQPETLDMHCCALAFKTTISLPAPTPLQRDISLKVVHQLRANDSQNYGLWV